MTSIAWLSAVLERIVLQWVAKIVQVFGIIVGLILANVGKVRNTIHKLGVHAFARKPSPEFVRVVMADLNGRSEAPIKALFKALGPEPLHRFMSLDQSVLLTATAAVLIAGRRRGTNLADAGRKVMRCEEAKAYDTGAISSPYAT